MKPHKSIFVRATRDFTVGHMRRIAVAKGQIRLVKPNAQGAFWTTSDTGGTFGVCHLDNGWERANPNDGDVAAFVDRANRDKRL